MSTRSKLALIAGQAALAVALGCLPALAVGLWGWTGRRDQDGTSLMIAGGAGLLAATTAWLSRLVYAVHRSRRRMSDPWYQARLVQFAIQTERTRAGRPGAGQDSSAAGA